MVGFAWAHWDRALTLRGGWAYLGVAGAWLLLSAGTLWLNAALDRDEGEVLYGDTVPPPPGVERWGYGALAAAVLIAAISDPLAGVCAGVCAVLSVLYSHPATCWKGHPVGGPVVNGLGYGLLSPMAGWAAADVSANPRTIIAWLLGGVGVLGCYFAAQAFQQEEDAARGYRTMVVTHGPRGALRAARLCLLIGFAGGMVLTAIGWFPYICAVGAPLWWWIDRWLVQWSALPGGGSAWHARVFTQRLLVAVVVSLVLVSVEYVRESIAEEPVAGLGTAAGYPSDRPRLSPRAMIAWEIATGRELVR